MTSSAFFEFFVEQEAWEGPLYLAPAAGLYLAVVAVLAVVVARRVRVPLWQTIAAAGAALSALIVLLSVYEGVVLYLRSYPTRDEFLLSARLAFFGVYLAVLAAALGVGRVLGLSWRAAAGSVALTLVFLALTFRYVEFLNACNIGEPVLWPSYVPC